MRESHVADEGTYAACALLRAICSRAGAPRLAVNWYQVDAAAPGAVPPERCHLDDPAAWSGLDPALLRLLSRLDGGGDAGLAHLREAGVLPADTLWFSDPVPEDRASRTVWHRRALARTESAGIVYLAPDAGLEAPVVALGSRRDRRSVALDVEVADYLARGQAVVCYQRLPAAAAWPQVIAGLRPRLAALPGAPAPATVKLGEHGFLLLATDRERRDGVMAAARDMLARASAVGWTQMPIVLHEGAGLTLAQAGAPHDHAVRPLSPVERAIAADPRLLDDDRELLMALYRRMRLPDDAPGA